MPELTIDEYLGTVYRPDCDYVDGALVCRYVGEYSQSRLMTVLACWFGENEERWHSYTAMHLRTRVSATRVRVPEISLIRCDAPREQVTVTPPLLCVEILSAGDTVLQASKVMEDYARMGVENLWILDPVERVAYTYKRGGELRLTSDRLSISGTPIYVDLPELFARLD